ncbi:MAG: aspartate ammonia-lyase, partial [Bifidobacteriaceae bacterium]|nr:aspartate ammonia-lyase [Bifidobacteriaceae bacterium]
ICKACDELIEGKLLNEFQIDVIQGGAGTSTNMAMNEIIANRALELIGSPKGDYETINPNDDVNRSQSTNDTYPAALKITIKTVFYDLIPVIESLINAFETLAQNNKSIELMGMTQLRNAVKMSYYDLFHGYAASLTDALENIKNSLSDMNEIALGGTAIGTGIGAPHGFGEKAVEYLNSFAPFKFTYSREAVSIISDPGSFATVSSALKQFAIRIGKITDDIRLLASSRFGNITIPAKQLGSSIMPGKINPVIPEAMNAVSMVVLGNDNVISNCLQSGQLQLNPFVPLIAHKLLDSSAILKNAIILFEKECVRGIKVNAVPDFKNNDDTDYLTHLVDKIGYKEATQIKLEAQNRGVSPQTIAKEHGLI